MQNFDVIIVGGGHAGCEAAAAAARMGAQTALITHKLETIGEMSCNPAIGGLGKGHLVREIDALDGIMGRIIDQAGIQFRMLNASKGPAVRGPRAQADRKLYREAMQKELSNTPNLTLIAAAIEDLITDEQGQAIGVVSSEGQKFGAAAVVLTTGTFLRGLIHLGEKQIPAGRVGEKPATGLSERIDALGVTLGRLKTGTPARLDGRTINWDILEEQIGDLPAQPFSMMTSKILVPQISCYITWTNSKMHEIIQNNLHRAPMYSGQIDSKGPRYCPSIEDKVVRFADKERHQIFLEPEGLDDHTVYPNGISTSLPEEVQDEMIHTILGLEDVKIIQPGYAIEYDYVDPRQISRTLETRVIPNLFLAGQINGTTGYEEAAAQGLMAGVNAALKAEKDDREFILDRSDAYIGVMIDDLVSRGASEPYRMFTSRAEYRLRLRADNADQRLTQKGIEIGCVGHVRQELFSDKVVRLAAAQSLATSLSASPSQLAKQGLKVNQDGQARSVVDLLRYPNISFADLCEIWPELVDLDADVAEQVEIDALYSGYLSRQEADIKLYKKDEALRLPKDLDYSLVGSLSNEVRQKLELARPETLGAASRLQGVTPAALVALLKHVKRKKDKAA